MSEFQSISIKEGQSCKLDAERYGTTIQGPAIILILKNVKDMDIARAKLCGNTKLDN